MCCAVRLQSAAFPSLEADHSLQYLIGDPCKAHFSVQPFRHYFCKPNCASDRTSFMSRSREKGVAAMVNRISLHHSSANQDFDLVAEHSGCSRWFAPCHCFFIAALSFNCSAHSAQDGSPVHLHFWDEIDWPAVDGLEGRSVVLTDHNKMTSPIASHFDGRVEWAGILPADDCSSRFPLCIVPAS